MDSAPVELPNRAKPCHPSACVRAALIAGLLVLSVTGCTPVYHPRIQLNDSVVRPERAVVLVTVDGLAESVMDDMLAAGELPHVATLIDRGVRVRRAVCSLPALTYANLSTILTGCHPSRHGVLANSWFDRETLTFRDYTTTRTYRDADGDLRVPTVYEYLGDEFTVSIQCAIRRGVGRTIDNWATTGIRWFFGGFEATDQLMPWRFDIIVEEARRRGRWPALIHLYFPGVDEIGHRWGADSPVYRRALANVDRQIGLIGKVVTQARMADRTCTILVADHNHTPVPPGRWFDVARWLRRAGLRVRTTPLDVQPPDRREAAYRDVDAVVVVGGDRFAAVHLKGPTGWHELPAPEQVAAVLGAGSSGLLAQAAIDLVAVPRNASDSRRVVPLLCEPWPLLTYVFSAGGTVPEPSSRMVPGPCPELLGSPTAQLRPDKSGLRWTVPPTLNTYLLTEQWHPTANTNRRVVDLYYRRGHFRIERPAADDGRADRYIVRRCEPLRDSLAESDGPGIGIWPATTLEDAGAGVLEQLADLFDSPRAGDVAIFAAEGWDFAPGNRGGHGGIGATDVRVPMIFSGPMIDGSAVITAAGLVDVTPTILGLLGRVVRSSGVPACRHGTGPGESVWGGDHGPGTVSEDGSGTVPPDDTLANEHGPGTALADGSRTVPPAGVFDGTDWSAVLLGVKEENLGARP